MLPSISGSVRDSRLCDLPSCRNYAPSQGITACIGVALRVQNVEVGFDIRAVVVQDHGRTREIWTEMASS
jgi:hypothetical protein